MYYYFCTNYNNVGTLVLQIQIFDEILFSLYKLRTKKQHLHKTHVPAKNYKCQSI